MDNYKGLTHLGSQQDQDPKLGLLYLAAIPVLAGVGFVAWLGWGWQAILLTALATAVVIGALAFRRASGRGTGRRNGDNTASAYDEARTKTVEHQTRMHLDSKGPLGF